jgi:hypothetical protein
MDRLTAVHFAKLNDGVVGVLEQLKGDGGETIALIGVNHSAHGAEQRLLNCRVSRNTPLELELTRFGGRF